MPDGFPVPDPELLEIRDAGRSRSSLERLGAAVWTQALDWLYGEAMVRPIQRESYPDSRRRFFGPSNEPAPAPQVGSPSEEVLAEFRDRVAPMTFNAQFPGAFSYFTPPPLAMSIGGEVLAQWLHQRVDVWHAGWPARWSSPGSSGGRVHLEERRSKGCGSTRATRPTSRSSEVSTSSASPAARSG